MTIDDRTDAFTKNAYSGHHPNGTLRLLTVLSHKIRGKGFLQYSGMRNAQTCQNFKNWRLQSI